jgi:hypothetical protein
VIFEVPLQDLKFRVWCAVNVLNIIAPASLKKKKNNKF